jgi:catechol 2,3-dioxygenase-like lactoylglutathione lyase family enzyme
MFTHVFLGAKDIEASRKFYDAALGALGHAPGTDVGNRYVYRTPTGTFGITLPINGEPATFGNGSTFGFAAKSPAEVDAFHAAGIANGGVTCEDPPGLRTNPSFSYYIAYLRDPAGNKICAMCRPAK